MKFATTKQRIIQYIENKGISVKDFLEKTEIKRGFLDSDKLESTVSDVFITKIIAKYNDINIEWLLTGKGSMLKSEEKDRLSQNITGNSNIQSGNDTKVAGDNSQQVKELQKQLKEKDKEIERLKTQVDKLFKMIP